MSREYEYGELVQMIRNHRRLLRPDVSPGTIGYVKQLVIPGHKEVLVKFSTGEARVKREFLRPVKDGVYTSKEAALLRLQIDHEELTYQIDEIKEHRRKLAQSLQVSSSIVPGQFYEIPWGAERLLARVKNFRRTGDIACDVYALLINKEPSSEDFDPHDFLLAKRVDEKNLILYFGWHTTQHMEDYMKGKAA